MLPLIRNLRPDVTGYWGHGSASVDWCESNYTVTMYLAEFSNSLSSFAMILAGLLGMYLHPNAEFRFHMAFASTIILGIGSVAFHGTLYKLCQALDEVPMLYCVLTLSYIAVGLRYPNFPRFWQRVLAWSLILYASLLTLLVTVFDGQLQFTLFHISFNSGQWYALYQSYKLYRSRKNGQNGISSSSSTTSTKKKTASSFLSSGLQSRVTTRNQSRMEPLIKTFERGVLFYTLAILSWLTDMFLCEYLNPEYSSSVLPFNPQLHAWWHTFISIGLYHFVVFLLGERAHVLAKVNSKGQMQQRIKVMHWMGCVPYIVTETVGQQSRKRAAETTRLLNDF